MDAGQSQPHGLVVKIPYTLPPGPILDFANAVQRAFDTMASPKALVVADLSSLPPAAANNPRIIIVRDIDGGGTKGLAFSLDGAWYDINGGAL